MGQQEFSVFIPYLYELLTCFEEKKNIPVLLNTSFNLRGEPIVNSPKDALRTFYNSGMDYLVMENILVKKEKLKWT